MLEIALHNPRQHRQFQHAGGRLMLARADASASLWTSVDPSRADHTGALLEFNCNDDGISLAATHCRAECQCHQNRGSIDSGRLPVPTRFVVGDTLFEVTRSCAKPSTNSRTLQNLHT